MRLVLALLVMSILFGCAIPARAADLPIVALHPDTDATEVRDAIRYAIVAPDEAVSVDDLQRLEAVEHASLQFGTVGQTAIVGLRLKNVGDTADTWFLSTGRGSVDLLQIYRVDGAIVSPVFDNRDRASLGRSLADYQAIATEVRLGAGEEATYLFKFRDTITSWMPITVSTYGTFFRERRANIAMVSAVIVGSLVLVFLSMTVFASTGRREFLWLGAAELAFALNTFHTEGYSTIFGLYRWPAFATAFGEVSRTTFCLFMIQFGRILLQSRQAHPRLDLFLRIVMAAGLGLVVLALLQIVLPTVPAMALRTAGWLYLLVTALLLPVLASLSIRSTPTNWPLLVGWTVVAIYIVHITIAISGLVPGLPVYWHWLGPIGFFECLMASLTLALHLRQLYTSRVKAERVARDALLSQLALSEETARLAEEKARALSEVHARDRLLVGSAHDTRHVLHALNTAVYFGKSQSASQSSQQPLIELIESSARHLEDIISSSISVTKREGDFVALSVVDLAPLLGSLGSIYEPIARKNGIELTIECDPDCAALIDDALFARLTSNLLNNALKFTEKGQVAVTCENRGSLLYLVVSDTGVGIDRSIADWLNDNVGSAAKPAPELGINTGWRAIRAITELLRGSYLVDSDGQGTSIEIVLPNPASSAVTPCRLQDLASAVPELTLVAMEDVDDRDFGSSARIAVIADNSDAASREAAASVSSLLLSRPLCIEMADHPYVRSQGSNPLALAASTS